MLLQEQEQLDERLHTRGNLTAQGVAYLGEEAIGLAGVAERGHGHQARQEYGGPGYASLLGIQQLERRSGAPVPEPRGNEQSQALRRVQHREPILARKAGAPLRLRRWLQRYPTRSVAVALLAVLVAVSIAWAGDLRAAAARARATTAATAMREGLAAAHTGA